MLLSVRHVRVSQSAVYRRAGQVAWQILPYGRADTAGRPGLCRRVVGEHGKCSVRSWAYRAVLSLVGTSDASQPLPRPGYMPTFTSPPGGDGDVLASALLAHLGGATPIPASVAMANAGPSPLPEELRDLPGFATVPPKLIRRVCQGEFTEMWEMLPESWRAEAMIGSCCHSRRPRRGPITDFAVWAECYATLAAILAASHPSKAPHFFAYLRTIARTSRNYDGGAWATYNAAYRRQAANCNNWNWDHVDAPLFSETFAGRARVIPRCRFCSMDTHGSPDCPYAPDDGRPPLDNRTLRRLG